MFKTAFFTIDVETLFEANCLENHRGESNVDGKEGFVSLLNTLDSFNIRATLFLTGEAVEKWNKEIKEAVAKGHELSIHALEHKSVVGISDEEFENSILMMKKLIEENFSVTPAGYRAPCFGIDENKIKILKKCGLKYDSSALNFKKAIYSGSLDLSGYEKINDCIFRQGDFFEIKPTMFKTALGEFPVSGGGYLRLAPWTIVKPALKKYIKSGDSYVFYVHPFEVYDGNIPRFDDMKLSERIYLERGRKSYLNKITEILKMLEKQDFEFKTISESISVRGA